MKAMVMNFGFFLMLFISSVSIASIGKKQTINEEVTEAVSVATRNSMELWLDNPEVEEEVLADNFIEVFKMIVNSKSTYNVYFYEIDTVNGIMDVEVEAKFSYPTKRTGTVNVRKTMIYDEKMN